VRDRLEASGWEVQVAHARKVRDVAPLACKTDRVDARVLAELCRRDLVPELWVPSLEDRALRERLRRRMHLVRTRTAARNRIFGLLTQFGLRVSYRRLRRSEAMELLRRRGVPEVWRASIAELLELAEEMDRRIDPIDRVLAPLARADERARLLATIPGIGPLLGLTFAAEIGEVSRFRSPGKLIGYAGLAPRVSQSGERSATGALSKAGSRNLRWAAVEAANQAWRPSNPWHAHYLRVAARHGKNPAKSAVARKLLIAAWHMLSRGEPFKPPAPAAARTLPRRAPAAF
jgi:transposase